MSVLFTDDMNKRLVDKLEDMLGMHFMHDADTLPMHKQVCVGMIPARDDGQDVEVHVECLPAVFCTIIALPRKIDGYSKEGFTIETGSGMEKWAIETALHIAQGMVGVEK